MWTDLTIPEPGSRTTYELLSRYLKDQYRQLRHVPEVAPLLKQVSPGALFAALRRPTVGGPLRCLSNRRTDRALAPRLRAQVTAQLAFELAADGAPVTLEGLADAPARLVSLGARRAVTLKAGGPVRFVEGTIAPECVESVEEATHHPLRGNLWLATVDNNPLADEEAHPDKSGNRVDLGNQPLSRWIEALDEAMAVVEAFLPEIAAEMALVSPQVVPVGYEPERHLSASYQEVVGNIYLTLHPDVLTLAEALVHEFQHNKLNMLTTLSPLLENAFHPLYTSPIRPDPRPLHGILLAAHAFLPVERLYQRLAEAAHPLSAHRRFASRRTRIRQNNQEAVAVLETHARPTPEGTPLLAELTRWNESWAP